MVDKKLIKGFYRRVLNEYKYLDNAGGKDESDSEGEDYSQIFDSYE